jgi:hypothetical protein
MTPLTTRQQQLIAKNVLAACKDITKLNKTGYNFLYLANGFIAHYNLQGFIAHYSEHDLQADIERNAVSNQWRNFRAGEQNYDYYMAKRECYNMILGGFVAEEVQNIDHAKLIKAAQAMGKLQFVHIG